MPGFEVRGEANLEAPQAVPQAFPLKLPELLWETV